MRNVFKREQFCNTEDSRQKIIIIIIIIIILIIIIIGNNGKYQMRI